MAVQWEKFSDAEHTQLASTTFTLLRKGTGFSHVRLVASMHTNVPVATGCQRGRHACAVGGTASDYAIRSKAAVLLALVTKRQGGQLLQALMPELLRLAAEGPTQAEMVWHP